MTYTFHETTDVVAFDAFVQASDQNCLHQCSSWAKVKKGWKSMLTSVTDENGTIVATALILIRKMVLHKTLFYVPRGPIMDYDNDELVSFMLMYLAQLAHKNHAICLRFDPNIKLRVYPFEDRDKEIPYMHEELIARLEDHGAKHKGFTTHIIEATQPRFNAQMDVYEGWQKDTKRKTMRCVEQASKQGVTLFEGREYLDDFITAMHYTEVRKQIALRSKEYFLDMLDAYQENSICLVAKINLQKQLEEVKQTIEDLNKQLETCSKKKQADLNDQLVKFKKEQTQLQQDLAKEGQEEVIVSGALACYNDGLMEIFYMGNNPDYLRTNASYLVWATLIDRCVQLGIPSVSFGGIEGTLDDGLTQFKSKWLMNVEEYIGEFNMVFDPIAYNAFEKVYPKFLEFAAKARAKK